jgi:hypothetical protein
MTAHPDGTGPGFSQLNGFVVLPPPQAAIATAASGRSHAARLEIAVAVVRAALVVGVAVTGVRTLGDP